MSEHTQHSEPFEYARPGLTDKHASADRRSRIVALLIVSGLAAVLLCSFMFSSGRSYRISHRVQCANNMRQIGQAIAMYANDHNDQFPDDVKTILETEDLTAAVFVCPSTNDQPAPAGPTTQATAAGLLQPGHLSYVYLGKGLTSHSATDDTVLLYEPLSNHEGAGMNVLFGDFHVEWLPAAEAATILKQVAGKRRPVRYPLTQPSTQRTAG